LRAPLYNLIVDKEFQYDIFSNIEDARLFMPDVVVVCSPAPTHLYFAQIFADIKSNIFIILVSKMLVFIPKPSFS
jgi:hypothetical protein